MELVRKQHAFSPFSCIKSSKECTFLLRFPYGGTSWSHTPGPSLLSSPLTYHLCYPFCPHFLLSLLFSLEHVAFSPCRQLCDNVSTKPYCGSSKFCGRSNQFRGRKDACFVQIRTTPFCLAIKGMLWSLFFPLVLGSSQRCCWSLGRRKQCSMPAPLQS